MQNLEKEKERTIYQRVIEEFQKEERDSSIIQKEWFCLQPKLVLCGGGHVAASVARLAKMLDFYVQVIDDREEFANWENLPYADEICCHRFENAAEVFPKEENVYYVVATRGHIADRICVEQILRRSYSYLGMIGSKIKVAKTFDALIKEGFEKELIDKIHAPIGLAIKAQTPNEIAVSIMAEIIACKNSKAVSSMSRELSDSKDRGVLCIIIAKSGSSPRNVGSMMLVKKDGSTIGSIGGGIIEHEAILDAVKVDKIMDKSYNLSNNESANFGMICGGKNRVLFVPVN